MTKIYFARHGQSIANRDGIAAGSHDYPLTHEGLEQARHEAIEMVERGLRFDLIIASSLSRAYDTACMIARGTGYNVNDIITTDLLWERHLGIFEGGLLADFIRATEEEKLEGGCEPLEALYQRVKNANSFIEDRVVGNTLVVGHSGFYRMARCVAEDLSPSTTYSLDVPKNSSVIEYPLRNVV